MPVSQPRARTCSANALACCLQELQLGVYSISFNEAPTLPSSPGSILQPAWSEPASHESPTDGRKHENQHDLSRQQSPSEVQSSGSNGTARLECRGTLVEHPWQDPMIAALHAGRALPLPSADSSPASSSDAPTNGQLQDGFEAAVTDVLRILGEAVRVRCRCIDQQVARSDSLADGKHLAKPTGVPVFAVRVLDVRFRLHLLRSFTPCTLLEGKSDNP